jgi:hypothetical protein
MSLVHPVFACSLSDSPRLEVLVEAGSVLLVIDGMRFISGEGNPPVGNSMQLSDCTDVQELLGTFTEVCAIISLSLSFAYESVFVTAEEAGAGHKRDHSITVGGLFDCSE